ncbi:hypothetical protein E6E07_09295 [Escherichia coli]|nr:hypothetical protein [Escherichia coli]EFN4540925.1 hypothetical protein [Escherichia coli]
MTVEETENEKYGRPTKYTQRRAEAIIDLLLEGYSLMRIGKMPGMPCVRTIRRWRIEYPMFDDAVRRAVAMVEEDDYAAAIDLANGIGPGDNIDAIELQMKAYWARAKRQQLGPRIAVTTINQNGTTTAAIEQQAEPREWYDKALTDWTEQDLANARSHYIGLALINNYDADYLEDITYNWRYCVDNGQFVRQRINLNPHPQNNDRDELGYIEVLK